MLTAKVHSVAALKVLQLKRRNSNAMGIELRQRTGQSRKIVFIGENDNVTIPTKLGRAVEHASLTAHQQVPNFVGSQRRKDFEDRVRDQASLLLVERIARASSTRASGLMAPSNTILPRNLHDPGHRQNVHGGPFGEQSTYSNSTF